MRDEIDPEVAAGAPKARRRGAENSEKRTAILDAAERLILQKGYAAVTARQLATEAGLKSQLIHYYFETMDELFVAVIRRRATRNLARWLETLSEKQPIELVVRNESDAEATRFWQEFLTLANHRKTVRDEVRHYTEQKRLLQAAAMERSFQQGGVKSDFPPVAWSLLVGGLSHVMAVESRLGLSLGHKDAIDLVRSILSGQERVVSVANAGDQQAITAADTAGVDELCTADKASISAAKQA